MRKIKRILVALAVAGGITVPVVSHVSAVYGCIALPHGTTPNLYVRASCSSLPAGSYVKATQTCSGIFGPYTVYGPAVGNGQASQTPTCATRTGTGYAIV